MRRPAGRIFCLARPDSNRCAGGRFCCIIYCRDAEKLSGFAGTSRDARRGGGTMHQWLPRLRPDTRWRYVPPGWDPKCLQAPGLPKPPEPAGPPAAWVFPCPNPGCDTELVILPEHAGVWVECPTCGLRFVCPRAASASTVAKAQAQIQAARPAPQESKAVGALESLSRANRTPGSFPAPARTHTPFATGAQPKSAPTPRPKPTVLAVAGKQRAEPRVHLGPRAGPAPAAAAPHRRNEDLALTWIVALAAAGGVIVAGLLSETPDLALGSLVFIALAAVRTALVYRR